MATGTQTSESQSSGALVLAVFGALLAVLVGGVGVAYGVRGINENNNGGGGGSSAPSNVNIDMSEFKFDPAMLQVAVGGTITATNKGSVAHNLEVEGTGVKTPDIAAGTSGKLDLSKVQAGAYTLFCNIAGHREAGMTARLTVLPAGSTAIVDTAAPPAAAGAMDMSAPVDPFNMTLEQKRARADIMDKAMDARAALFPAETQGKFAGIMEPRIVNGVKEYDLTAKVVKWETEPGKIVDAWTYNGSVPGPTIKVNVGDTLRIKLINELPESTVIHYHGISDIPNAMDGVPPITQHEVKPGDSFVYEFKVTRPAVAMYHSHHNAQTQVPNGLAGALLVGEVPIPAGIPKPVWSDTMFLNDAGTLGLGLDGKSFPATRPFTAKMGEWIEMHYMNEGLQIHPMHLHGPRQLVTAIDGEPLAVPYWEDTVNVAPGQRVTVLVQADNPGVWAWHCHILNHAEGPQGMFGMVTALIIS